MTTMHALTLLPDPVRDDAARLARAVIEGAMRTRVRSPALGSVYTEAAGALAKEPAGAGPHAGRLREPVFQLLLDVVQSTTPEAEELVLPALRAELEDVPFRDGGRSPGLVRTDLCLGACDDAGAARYGLPATTGAGRVTTLQHDLRVLGFRDCPTDGYYGLGTARAVQAFQDQAARCSHGSGRVTFAGSLDGRAGQATLDEIARWQHEQRSRHAVRLSTPRMDEIVRTVAGACEPGTDPYAFLGAIPDGGAVYGIGKFIQRRGDLGELLARLFFAEPYLFGRLFGRAGRDLVFQLMADSSSERGRTDVAKHWGDRLRAAAAVPIWRAEQVSLSRDRALVPLLDVCRDTGIVHARGLALVYRANVLEGFEEAERVAAAIGPRPAGVAPARHVRDAVGRIRATGLAGRNADLLEDLISLSSVAAFDDCEELEWW